MSNQKKQAEGAQAPEAKKNENKANNKTKKINNKAQDNKEWLEEELEEVDIEDAETSSEELMKKAADQIENLQGEVKEWKDNYLRLHAEWDTYRRRSAEQREVERAQASEALVTDILPVLDDFERSIDYANNNGETGLLDGVKAVHSKIIAALEKNGAVVINPDAGEAFNALEHQAVSTVEDKDKFDESIAGVMQKGYKMGNKVIRPAMVSVTTGGKKRPQEDEEEKD